MLISTSVEGRWKWTRLSWKDHEEGGEENEGRMMALKRPEEKERLTLALSSATTNLMEGPEVALDLVVLNSLLWLSEYWFTR